MGDIQSLKQISQMITKHGHSCLHGSCNPGTWAAASVPFPPILSATHIIMRGTVCYPRLFVTLMVGWVQNSQKREGSGSDSCVNLLSFALSLDHRVPITLDKGKTRGRQELPLGSHLIVIKGKQAQMHQPYQQHSLDVCEDISHYMHSF